MDFSWTVLKDVCKEAARNTLCPCPFQLIGKTTDSLTKRTIFKLKAKKSTVPFFKTPQEIIHSDYHFSGLSVVDRKAVEKQYLFELSQPKAFIEEFPITFNEHNELIFKVLLLDERKLICGSATYFFTINKDILSMLKAKDLVTLTKAYCMENISALPDEVGEKNLNLTKQNVHYIK